MQNKTRSAGESSHLGSIQSPRRGGDLGVSKAGKLIERLDEIRLSLCVTSSKSHDEIPKPHRQSVLYLIRKTKTGMI